MGESRQMRQEAQKRKEKFKKRAITTIAAAAMGASAFAGIKITGGDSPKAPTPTATTSAEDLAEATAIPKQLLEQFEDIKKRGNKDIDFEKLKAIPYYEYGTYNTKNNKVHLVSFGDNDVNQLIPKEIHQEITTYLDNLLNMDQKSAVRFYSDSKWGNEPEPSASSIVVAQTDLEPRNKDYYLLYLPDDFSIGEFAGSPAHAYTYPQDKATVTFIRDKAIVNTLVETCQAFVSASITNPKDFPEESLKYGLSHIYQEQFCNSVGYALSAVGTNTPYDAYAFNVLKHLNQLALPASRLEGTKGGYVSEIPYLDEFAYKSMASSQPVENIGNHFLYPRFG